MSPKNKISHKLQEVVRREVGIELNKEHQSSDWSGELADDHLDYAARDSQVLIPVYESLRCKIETTGLQRATEVETRALPAVTRMANAGVPFDVGGLEEYLDQARSRVREAVEKLNDLSPEHPEGKDWNWNSPKQIIQAFGLLGIRLPDTKEETIARCNHPLSDALLEYKKASKIVSTYGQKLLDRVEDGRIYASWRQIGAGTGRMACSSPNLQNLPPEVRKFVRAPEGRLLIKADYSQIELRIAAKISGDERMLEAFANGEDIHEITARSVTGKERVTKDERKLAKAVNFGLLYGMSPGGLRSYARASYGIEMTAEEAESYWQDFFKTYPGLRQWHDKEYRQLKKHRSTETRTLTGRRRMDVRKLTEKLNSPVQGTGADGLKLALALLWERRHECPAAAPILAVHDEIVVECNEDEAEQVGQWLEKAMIDGMDVVLNCPETGDVHIPVEVEVESGRSWHG